MINIEDDPEPPIAMMDPASVRTTLGAEAKAKLGNDHAANIQGAPKKLSPSIKLLRLTGEPSLKLRISTRYVLLLL